MGFTNGNVFSIHVQSVFAVGRASGGVFAGLHVCEQADACTPTYFDDFTIALVVRFCSITSILPCRSDRLVKIATSLIGKFPTV